MKLKLFLGFFFLLILVGSVLGVATSPTASDTVAYWPLENLTDTTGNGYTLTNNGATSGATGIIDDAYSFDGSNDYMSANANSVNIQNSFSISLWFKTNTNAKDNILTKWISVNDYFQYQLRGDTTGSLLVMANVNNNIGADGYVTTGVVNDNNWHFIVTVYNSSSKTYSVYLDNSLVDSITLTDAFDFNPGLELGRRDYSTDYAYFAGVIDEVATFNTVLTTDNIEYLYASGSPNSSQQYPFNGSSPVVNNFSVTAKDVWSEEGIDSFNITIDGTTVYNSTNGTVTTLILQNSTSLYDILVCSEFHFCRTYEDVNVSSNLIAELSQSDISFEARQLLSNATVSGATFYVNNDTDSLDYATTIQHNTNAYVVKYTWDDLNVLVNNVSFELRDSYASYTAYAKYRFYYLNGSDSYSDEASQANVAWVAKTLSNPNPNEIVTKIELEMKQSTSYATRYAEIKNQVFDARLLTNLSNSSNPLSEGVYNVTAFAPDYTPATSEFSINALDNKTLIVYIGDATLIINATNAYTGNLITGFNGWIYSHEYDINITYSTLTDSYTKGLVAGNYTVYLEATNYSITSANTQNISIGSGATESLTFDLYTTNSVLISIYNDTTTNLLTQNVSITAIYGTSSFTRWTTNGTIYIDLLTPASYELTFTSQDFSTGTYYLTVLNDSTQTINVYLIPNASLELQRVLVVDDISSELSGAIVRLQKEEPSISGLWVTVDEKTTGSDGYTGFFVTKSISDYYRFIVIYEGITRLTTQKTLFLPSVDEVITLQVSILDDTERTIYDSITTDFEWSGSNNETFTFSWSDANNIISGAKITVYYKDYNITNIPAQLLYNATSTLTSGELTYTLPVVNDSEFTIRAYILTNDREDLYFLTTKIFGITMVVNKDLGLLLAIIVFAFVAFITISLKPLFSSILSFSVLAIMNAFQLISIPTTIITSFIALAVIFFIKLKGGNS